MRTTFSNSMANGATITAKALPPSPPAITQTRSPWHSPVPYLFGGLAAMLGLIAFALLILACSYWKLSGRLDDNNNNTNEGGDQRDLESGNEKQGNASDKEQKVYGEKILVIMAGQEKPTFLATPVSSRASSSVEKNPNVIENREGEKIENDDRKIKDEMGDHAQTAAAEMEENRETQESQETQEAHQHLQNQ